MSFKCVSLALRSIGKSIGLLLVYRKQEVAFHTFVDEFVSLTERYITDTAKLILLGDFNLHINELADPNVDTFHDLLECFNLKNNIFFPSPFANKVQDKNNLDGMMAAYIEDIKGVLINMPS